MAVYKNSIIDAMPSKTTLTIGGLVAALIASNALWAVHAFDQGVSLTYLRQSAEDSATLLDQTLAVLPVAARVDASQAEVVRAARRPGASTAHFEKSGYLWVDGLGLRFDSQGRLAAVTASEQQADHQDVWASSPAMQALDGGQQHRSGD